MALDIRISFYPNSHHQLPSSVLGGLLNVPVVSFNYGIENPFTIGQTAGSGGAGKAKFPPVTLTLNPCLASLALWNTLTFGDHFSQVVVTMTQPGEKSPVITYTLSLVGVSHLREFITQGEDLPIVEVTLVHGAMQVELASQYEKASIRWSSITNSQ
jgi:type VI protein secretion system component Hcp